MITLALLRFGQASLVLAAVCLVVSFVLYLLSSWYERSRRSPPSRTTEASFILATALFAIWFLLSLGTKAAWLYQQVSIDPHDQSVRLDLSLAVALIALFGAISWRFAPIALALFATGFAALTWTQVIHFRFFEDLYSLASFGAAGQLGALGESVVELLRPSDLLFSADVPVAAASAILLFIALRSRPKRAPQRSTRVGFALVGLCIFGSLLLVAARDQSTFFTKRHIVEEKGLLTAHLAEIFEAANQAWTRHTQTGVGEDLEQWFLDTAPAREVAPNWQRKELGQEQVPWNVVLLQVESFQDFVTDLEVGVPPQAVMPNLQRRLTQAFRFTEAYDQSQLGRTSDTEMIVLTSLLPVSSSPAAVRYGSNDFVSLPWSLQQVGYSSFSAIPFVAEFWNRTTTHKAYGFDRSYFRLDFEKTGTRVGWGLNDVEFLRQAIDKLEGQPEPFTAFLITLSLHWPYRHFPDELRQLPPQRPDPNSEEVVIEASESHSPLRNYLEAMRFFDEAFEEFMSALEANGLAQRTIVVLYGDHDAGLYSDMEVRRLLEIRKRYAPFNTLNVDQVPLAFWVPSGDGSSSWGGWVGSSDLPAGLVDVAPTILGLLGRDSTALPWQGRNLTLATNQKPGPGSSPSSPGESVESAVGGPVPIGLSGHWISEDMIYINRAPGPYRGRCYRRVNRRLIRNKELCVPFATEIERQLHVARDILRTNQHRALHDELVQREPPESR